MASNKTSRMAQEGVEQQAKERPYLASTEVWEQHTGPEFGGQADILQLNVGEVAGPFEYMGQQPMVMEGGKTITVHLGMTGDDETLRLPIAASFLRAIDQAEIQRGDKFLIRRSDNVKKKAGIGKGQDMQIYAIKPIFRAPRTAPSPAAAATA